ncbi:MFS transporter [Ectobacillus sp. sgz5001026]|uniref:MFS transporter n=1 Tax=Ectobacillus sp. sgz5001026 TaxID=3242473 RepID=UPI0036D34C11
MTTASQNQRWAIILFSIGVFMAALDNGIISSALTTINRSYEVSASWGAWGITLYTLGLSVSVPIIGKLSDRYGRKKLFMIEVVLFGLGSLLVALSVSFPMFLAARLVQSLGGGGIFIIGSSHILSTLPKEQQGKALGALGGMNGMAAVLGPNIGSFLLAWTGNWHWLFLINLPIAITLIILAFRFIQETKDPKNAPLDLKGTVLLALAVLSIMYGITNLNGTDVIKSLTNPSFFAFILAGIALFLVLLTLENRLERRGGDPVLPFSLLRTPVYLWTLVIGVFSGALIAAIIFIPAFVEQYLGVDAAQSGYWMTPLALASGVGAGLGGVFTDKKGPVFTIVLSSIVAFIGFSLFPFWVSNTWQFIIASCLAGFGFGMTLGAPVNVLATEGAGTDKGSALGTLSLSRQIGLTIAPTIYAGFLTRNFQTIGNEIMTNLQNAGVNPKMIPAGMLGSLSQNTSVGDMLKGIEKIPDPKIKEVIISTIHTVVGNGFGSLFLSAAVMSALMLIAIFVISLLRGKGKNVTNSAE